MTLKKKALENTVGKGENAGNQHFLLFSQGFLLYHREESSSKQSLICRLQMLSIWLRPKLCRLVKSKTKKKVLSILKTFSDNNSMKLKSCFFFFNPLPNNKIFDWSKLKAFADDNINVNEKIQYILGRVENTVKRRKCWLPEFSAFRTMFSKGYLLRVIK